MAPATVAKNPAYKTQWDPIVGAIRDITGVAENTDLCLSYLFSKTVFRGISEFLSHFEENESLAVLADQELAIWDVSPLNHDLEMEHPAMASARQKTDMTVMGLLILNRLLSALGKEAHIAFANAKPVTYKASLRMDREFSLTCSIGYTLKTAPGDLHIRITDLYRTMMASGIRAVKFASQQKVSVLCAHVELERIFKEVHGQDQSATILFSRVFTPLSPPGMSWNAAFGTNSSFKEIVYNPSSVHALQISADFFELSIADEFQFQSIRQFRERLLLGDLEVPPNQKLVIRDFLFPRIGQECEKIEKGGFDSIQFMLNQALLPTRETCVSKPVKGREDMKREASLRGHTLEVSTQTGFVLRREKGDLFANLGLLGDRMISERCSLFSVEPNQQLVLYDLTGEECEMIRTSLKGKQEEVDKATLLILENRSPLGFAWRLLTKPIFLRTCAKIGCSRDKEIDGLVLISSGGFTLSLERPSAPVFIRSIVTRSHPALLTSLRQLDPNAIKLLLFRAFFYYLCGNFRGFRSDEFPNFFRPEEQRTLVPNPQGRMQAVGRDPVVLVRNGTLSQITDESTVTKIQQKMQNPDLDAAIREMNDVPEYTKKMAEIIRMSPEEFNALSLDTLPAPIQRILKEIQPLVAKEVKSPFILEHLPEFLATLRPQAASPLDKSTDKKEEGKRA